MQIMKYGFLVFHVNTNRISFTSISKQASQTGEHKSSKSKKLTIYASTVPRLSSTQH